MDSDDSKTLLAVLGIPVLIVLMFTMFVPLGLFNAWAVQKMYIWFLLPLGAPAINIAHTWGISLILNHYLFNRSDTSSKKWWKPLAASLFGTGFMLLMGFILKGHI